MEKKQRVCCVKQGTSLSLIWAISADLLSVCTQMAQEFQFSILDLEIRVSASECAQNDAC